MTNGNLTNQPLKGETILIVGGTGSLGKALISRYIDDNKIIVYSRDEAKHWTIRNELGRRENLGFIIGDVRNRERLEYALLHTRPTIVIMAAALKHVDTCEHAPDESVATNITGVQNIIDIIERGTAESVHTVLMVSTDKACSPVNVYGMCKAISERIVSTAGFKAQHLNTKFVIVRYGNVLESRGSIIPLFRYQAENNERFTLTHADMTRFLMTLDDSIDLIESAIQNGQNGETWIPKLNAMRIKDLASIFSRRFNKPIGIIGMRPGEKIHESLINDVESLRTTSTACGRYYVLESMLSAKIKEDARQYSYTSADDVMSEEELEQHLIDLELLDKPSDQFIGQSIEEIRR